jgi:hypothetical protein
VLKLGSGGGFPTHSALRAPPLDAALRPTRLDSGLDDCRVSARETKRTHPMQPAATLPSLEEHRRHAWTQGGHDSLLFAA